VFGKSVGAGARVSGVLAGSQMGVHGLEPPPAITLLVDEDALHQVSPYLAEPTTALRGCAPGFFGLMCTGPDRPEQLSTSLWCGNGYGDGTGSLFYCCESASGSEAGHADSGLNGMSSDGGSTSEM
jgi:hypothetical protein